MNPSALKHRKMTRQQGPTLPGRCWRGCWCQKRPCLPWQHWTHPLTQVKDPAPAILLFLPQHLPSSVDPSHRHRTFLLWSSQLSRTTPSWGYHLLAPFITNIYSSKGCLYTIIIPSDSCLAPHQSGLLIHQTALVKITNQIHVTKSNGDFSSLSWTYQ